jgi:hypothetical protein
MTLFLELLQLGHVVKEDKGALFVVVDEILDFDLIVGSGWKMSDL